MRFPPKAGRIVLDAALLSTPGLGRDVWIGYRAQGLNGGVAGLETFVLLDAADLLDSGTWFGPIQRGPGACTSPWLAVS